MTLPVWRTEWLTALRRRRLLLLNTLIPLAFVAPIALSSAPAVHAAAAFTVLFALFGTFGSSIPLIRDDESGLLRRYMLTGVHPGGLLLQHVFANAALDLMETGAVGAGHRRSEGELGRSSGHGRAGDGTRFGRSERIRRAHRRPGQISRRGSTLLGPWPRSCFCIGRGRFVLLFPERGRPLWRRGIRSARSMRVYSGRQAPAGPIWTWHCSQLPSESLSRCCSLLLGPGRYTIGFGGR